MTGNLDMNDNRIYNLAQPNGDNQPATKIWSENKFLDKSSGVMAGLLNMSNNKITHLAPATQDGDATNKKYIDDNYLKLSGGTMTGHIKYLSGRLRWLTLACYVTNSLQLRFVQTALML